MFKIKELSKVILAAGAFAFATFYSVSSFAQSSLSDMVSSSIDDLANEKIDETQFNTPISNLKKAADAEAQMESSKQELDRITSSYESDIQALTDEISKGTVYDPETGEERKMTRKEKKALQEQLKNLKNQYAKEQSEAATAYNEALADYKSGTQQASSNLSVQVKKDAYNQARSEYNKLAACINAPKDCGYETSAELEAAMEAKKAEADAAYSDYKNEQNLLTDKKSQLNQDVQDAQNEVTSLEQKLEEAQAGCDYYNKNGAVSDAAKADKEKYCGLVDTYTSQLEEAKNKLAMAQGAAAAGGVSVESEHEGQVYAAFSTDVGAGGGEFQAGKYRGTATYEDTSGNIFQTITRRAMLIIVSLKPIVYVFAGFGLIGFAFMAIFNKISWKWFANIAIGLFLVANMGRFIEYFVFPDDGMSNNQLQYGDHLSTGFADTEYQWVDEATFYTPSAELEGEIPEVNVMTPEEESNTRGFCGKTEGASGFANFASCLKDITASAKKGVDTLKEAKNTVDTVKNTVNTIGNAAKNIGNAVSNIDSVSDVFKAAGQIGSNVNNMIGSAGGAVNGVMSNISDISNNVQDIGKSTDQVAELDEKRAKGEATNAIDRTLKGQTTGADGEVERLFGGTDQNGNAVAGDVATDSNIFTNIKNTTDNIVQKSKETNTMIDNLTDTAYEGTKFVEDTVDVVKDKINKKKQRNAKENSSGGSSNSSGNSDSTPPLATGDEENEADNGGSTPPLATGDEENAADNGGSTPPLATGDEENAADNGGSTPPLATGDEENAADNGGNTPALTRTTSGVRRLITAPQQVSAEVTAEVQPAATTESNTVSDRYEQARQRRLKLMEQMRLRQSAETAPAAE